jgi:solute carrier family 25 protein 44
LPQLLRDEGAAGFLRGVGPRVMSAMLWGTCMVSAFELLKRKSVRSEDADESSVEL